LLSAAFLHHAFVFLYVNAAGAAPEWLRYVQYNRFYDFALNALLAFAAMAMWIEQQNQQVRELGSELDEVRRESMVNLDFDGLTGLLNQSALAKRMAAMGGFEGVVSVCDMDNFKDINDRHGHLVGDEILRNVGHLLRASIRQEDEAFRWGGDEFVILFHNQNPEVVRLRMGDLEKRLREFQLRGFGVLPISFSWGTAEARGRPLRDTLDEADRCMYAFKRRRSNRAS
jgi:diguanylate cyclase (GGDEF)-like protein